MKLRKIVYSDKFICCLTPEDDLFLSDGTSGKVLKVYPDWDNFSMTGFCLGFSDGSIKDYNIDDVRFCDSHFKNTHDEAVLKTAKRMLFEASNTYREKINNLKRELAFATETLEKFIQR